MLAERATLDMEDAFSWLRNFARSHNLLLVDVAQSVIDGTVVPDLPARLPVPLPRLGRAGGLLRRWTPLKSGAIWSMVIRQWARSSVG